MPAPIMEPVRAPDELKSLARADAEEYGLDSDKFIKVIDCETAGTWDPSIQSAVRLARDGGRELSFGLAQIHLPDHPEVTRQEAMDPNFSLDWMARRWHEGAEHQWSCY